MTSAPPADLAADSPATTSDVEAKLPAGRIAGAIIFMLLAILFFVAGVTMAVVPDNHLPGILGHSASDHRHALRGVGSILVGLVFTVAAWFALRYRSVALEQARAADRAAAEQASAGRARAAAGGQGAAAEPATAEQPAGTDKSSQARRN